MLSKHTFRRVVLSVRRIHILNLFDLRYLVTFFVAITGLYMVINAFLACLIQCCIVTIFFGPLYSAVCRRHFCTELSGERALKGKILEWLQKTPEIQAPLVLSFWYFLMIVFLKSLFQRCHGEIISRVLWLLPLCYQWQLSSKWTKHDGEHWKQKKYFHSSVVCLWLQRAVSLSCSVLFLGKAFLLNPP